MGEGSVTDKPGSEEWLHMGVEALPGVAEKRAALLARLNIRTVGELLHHLPRDYQDLRSLTPIMALQEGERHTIQATVRQARVKRLRRGLSMVEVTLKDDSGEIKAIWFGREFLVRAFQPGIHGLFTGVLQSYGGELTLRNPEFELSTEESEGDTLNTGRIVPIYPLCEGVTQRMLRRYESAALDGLGALGETIPEVFVGRHGLMTRAEAFGEAHFPSSLEAARAARSRLAYEELLAMQLGILRERAQRKASESGRRHVVDGPLLARFRAGLPFCLTRGQERAVGDVLDDMALGRPMLRLLQGDVGCGKTLVALHALVAAADGGYQTAIMAPTEVLAEQHGLTMARLLEPLGLRVDILTGSTSDGHEARARVASGETHVVVGTHALIQESTVFARLGLAVIDEQHRFGVLQRNALGVKGEWPDILHMTATPIPRTLAVTAYGGMDLSVIDELPPGRTPVTTRHIAPGKVPGMYEFIRKQAARGFQTYYVCPLIEESERIDVASVTRHHAALSAGPFAALRTGLLHGRMKPCEKDAVMQQFRRGEVDVLFSTTVIEVGLDCPSATVMVIEDAFRFGLTQLHQLRGRVGRGGEQSFCFLLGQGRTKEGRERIHTLCSTVNGFEIAEADLRMRGPGEFQGLRQAGLSDLKVADLVRDARLLDAARRDAEEILAADPGLSRPDLYWLAERASRFGRYQA